MNPMARHSKKLGWLLCLMIIFAACSPANEVENETVTQEVPAATTETAVTSDLTPTLTATPMAEPTPTTAMVTDTAMAPEVSARLITDEPIFTGGDLQFQGWSPNGRYLTYFEYTEEQVATEPVEGLRGTYYYQIYPDGLIGYQDDNGRFWTRPVFESDAPFTEQAAAYNPWLQNETSLSVTSHNGSISLFDNEAGEIVDAFKFEGYESGYYFYPVLSPDGAWLAVVITEPQQGYGRALFVLPTRP